jgi:hypothetical protein
VLGGRGSNTVSLYIAGTQSLAYILMTVCKCFLPQVYLADDSPCLQLCRSTKSSDEL